MVLTVLALALSGPARAADQPRYDVPPGYLRCPQAEGLNGFFKWGSAKDATCQRTERFVAAYGRKAAHGAMPRRLHGFRCRIRYWYNEDGDAWASRHRCRRGRSVIRFYGMV